MLRCESCFMNPRYIIFHCANTPRFSPSSVVRYEGGFCFLAGSECRVTVFGHGYSRPYVSFSGEDVDVEGDTLSRPRLHWMLPYSPQKGSHGPLSHIVQLCRSRAGP